ncbi:MAG: 30S ribosomal protein S27e [Candidatus Diapherotrites archaeon]|nr:30S ribosomal protein S27e [Candidatus Diapherotrites archaeon]
MPEEQLVKKPRSFFIKVKCSGCGNEQIIFSAASRTVHCLACNQVLAESGSSRIRAVAKIIKAHL